MTLHHGVDGSGFDGGLPRYPAPWGTTQDERVKRWLPVRIVSLALGSVLALYLVGRGVAEFFIVRYGDPASYRRDWGGPSLAGVFAVHSGPAVVIVAGAAVVLWRRRRRRWTAGHRPR